MDVKVYKFGGASLKSSKHIENVVDILSLEPNNKTVVVVSATGKTTNAMEEVLGHYINGEVGEAIEKFNEIQKVHFETIRALGIEEHHALNDINDTFVEIEWMLEEEPEDSYDYLYDQIVASGELLSSKILHYALLKSKINNIWLSLIHI